MAGCDGFGVKAHGVKVKRQLHVVVMMNKSIIEH